MTDRQLQWDARWMNQCRLSASMSKDPSTKTGSVIVRPDNKSAGDGYNGFPPGHSDDPALYANREYKYGHIVHAEDNAIRNSRDPRHAGYTIYCWPLPNCKACAELIVTERFTRVVFVAAHCPELQARWADSLAEALDVYKNAPYTIEVVTMVEAPESEFGWRYVQWQTMGKGITQSMPLGV